MEKRSLGNDPFLYILTKLILIQTQQVLIDITVILSRPGAGRLGPGKRSNILIPRYKRDDPFGFAFLLK